MVTLKKPRIEGVMGIILSPSVIAVRKLMIFAITHMREPWEERFKLPIHDSDFLLSFYTHKNEHFYEDKKAFSC